MSQVDLNLFRVLDAVIRYGGVTTAAEMMEMTPSAISQAISRLTTLVGEPLFVRQGRGITPTARALSLHHEIMVPLHDMERSLQRTDLFDPQTSRRTFRIAGVPDIDIFFLPELNNLLQTQAPNCQLEWNTQVQDEALRQNSLYLHSVESGAGHQADGGAGDSKTSRSCPRALRIACRKDHPRIRQAPDMATFFNEKHVVLQTRRLDSLLLNTPDQGAAAAAPDCLRERLPAHRPSSGESYRLALRRQPVAYGEAGASAGSGQLSPPLALGGLPRLHELAQELRSGYRA